MTNRLASVLIGSALAAAASAQIGPLQLIGRQTFATKSQTLGGTTVGGLSGIDYDPATGNYYLQSDARVASPEEAPYGRFYTARIDGLAGGTFGAGSVAFTGVTTLKQPDGTAFPERGIDPESIRFHGGQFYVSSEGDRSGATTTQDPFVRSYDATGKQLSALPLPAKFAAVAGSTTQGIRNNLAFESLAFTLNGSLYTATENALYQDGPAASGTTGSNSRILRYAPGANGFTAAQEFVYPVERVAVPPTGTNFAVNGLTELLAVDDTHLLALERSFTVNDDPTLSGNTIRLYEIDLSGATDVSGVASLASLSGINPVSKRLIYDFNVGLGLAPQSLDNLEGMTWGPTLAGGSRTLVFVSDDNFNSLVGTQFFAFRVQATPEPATLAALGLGAAAMLRRRRRA